MSLIDRDDYDALVRAAKQLPVFERLPYKEDLDITQPSRGCFDCSHSVGSMSEGKKYSSVFFFPWISQDAYESGTHLVHGEMPYPVLSIVMSPEDKFYTTEHHYMNERVQNWDPPSSILVTRLNLDKLPRKEMYVRLVCEYDEDGTSRGVRHINGRINPMDYLNPDWPNAGSFIVVSSSSYLRGSYVDLEADFGLDNYDLLDEEPLYNIQDMLMTDDAWTRAVMLYGKYMGMERGPNLVKLNNPTPIFNNASDISLNAEDVETTNDIIFTDTDWNTITFNPVEQDDA